LKVTDELCDDYNNLIDDGANTIRCCIGRGKVVYAKAVSMSHAGAW
jgi:hypothetical protein